MVNVIKRKRKPIQRQYVLRMNVSQDMDWLSLYTALRLAIKDEVETYNAEGQGTISNVELVDCSWVEINCKGSS